MYRLSYVPMAGMTVWRAFSLDSRERSWLSQQSVSSFHAWGNSSKGQLRLDCRRGECLVYSKLYEVHSGGWKSIASPVQQHDTPVVQLQLCWLLQLTVVCSSKKLHQRRRWGRSRNQMLTSCCLRFLPSWHQSILSTLSHLDDVWKRDQNFLYLSSNEERVWPLSSAVNLVSQGRYSRCEQHTQYRVYTLRPSSWDCPLAHGMACQTSLYCPLLSHLSSKLSFQATALETFCSPPCCSLSACPQCTVSGSHGCGFSWHWSACLGTTEDRNIRWQWSVWWCDSRMLTRNPGRYWCTQCRQPKLQQDIFYGC